MVRAVKGSRDMVHVTDVLFLTEIPAECIADCSGPGRADDAVAYWRKELGFTVDRAKAIDCLEGYGAWERAELESDSDEDIASRILWLACVDFHEFELECKRVGIDPRGEIGDFSSNHGSDIFVLE